jgi:hypothetical protein
MEKGLKHTHYSPYEPPRQVVGTLLDCTPEFNYHKVEGTELGADYAYYPRFGPVSATGLPAEVEEQLRIAYLCLQPWNPVSKPADLQWRIADVVLDDEYTYRVKITNRTMYNGDGPDWHTEEWGIHADGEWHGIPKNPHPGYDHTPPWCPNCGY